MRPPEKALFLQLRRIGDVLMCTPAVRAFKKEFPDCRLDFLTELPDVLQGNPAIDEIIYVDRSKQFNPLYQYRLIRKIAKKKYNLVVDFFANPRSAYYSFLTGAEKRLSYGYGHRRWAYNIIPEKPGDPVYAAQSRLNLLKVLGIFSEDCRLEFYPTEKDREEAGKLLERISGKLILTVSPVSRRAFNRWPLENYARLLQNLDLEFEFSPVILTGPGEEHIGDELIGLMAPFRPLVLNIRRLGLLGAVLELAKIHIGNDNGPKHIAVACGAPTFTIYGPHSHISWTYPDSSRHDYIIPADCDPSCEALDHKCGPECIGKITLDALAERFRNFVLKLNLVDQTLRLK